VTRRDIIHLLRPVCREYDIRSVARLRSTLQCGPWLPRTVAAFVLQAEGVTGIGPILRLHDAEIPGLLVLMAVQIEENAGIKKEVGRCLRAADAYLEEVDPCPTF